MWLPRFACPDCRASVLDAGEDAFRCPTCRQRFVCRDGIYRFLTHPSSPSAGPFSRHSSAVSPGNGSQETAPEYYRMLPVVKRDDPRAAEWRIRRETYAHFQRVGLPAVWLGPVRILDLGAGTGWLSHRLASFGYTAVAVDRVDGDADGLGACRHYEISFPAVQADFDALPFEDAQFDVVVLNDSLHCSPHPEATLAEARRMLAPGGSLVVMDSPMFWRASDGHAMLQQQVRQAVAEQGVTDSLEEGVGFLTFDDLQQTGMALGLRGRFVQSRGRIGSRLRRQIERLVSRRPPAAFGVWVAQ